MKTSVNFTFLLYLCFTFLLQVSNDADQDRFTRSLVSLKLPMKTLSTASTTISTTSTTQPATTTTSEHCPPCTTTTIEPITCPVTTCPEYTTPLPTTTTTISEGGMYCPICHMLVPCCWAHHCTSNCHRNHHKPVCLSFNYNYTYT